MSAPGGRLPIVIRPLGPRDLPGLVRMRHGGVRLDLPETLLGAYTPLKGLAESRWLPFRRGRVRTYVAFAERVPCAFVQARSRPAGHKWDILHLGAASGGAIAGGRVELWTALLDYATIAAGRRGVRRLYAKLPALADPDAAAALRAAGYARYGGERVYLLHGDGARIPVWGRDGAGSGLEAAGVAGTAAVPRPQRPDDTWALHQLYTWTAPKPVQHAEAYTSDRWEVPKGGRLRGRGGLREWGFIAERGHEIAVYCRVSRRGWRSRLEFVFDPHGRELLAPTLAAVLRWLAPVKGERVYCTAREFQEELVAPLEAHGFEPLGEQDLFVRYTTVSARSPARYRWPALEKRRVAVPARLSLQREGMGPLEGRREGAEEPVLAGAAPGRH
ncbi:MAG: hypothetical protein M3Q65_25340 [Chloroflexota bacterium]|nr:hypothetical protein [Chloroflexota bacterium]